MARQVSTEVIANTQRDSLRQWNLGFAAVYAVQAIVLLLLATTKSLPVTIGSLTVDSLIKGPNGSNVLVPITQHIFDIRLVYLIAAFLLIPAIAHGLAAWRFRDTYEADLSAGTNRLRWIGNGIGSGLMFVLVALLCGITDVTILLALGALTGVFSLAGYLLERLGRRAGKTVWAIAGIGAGIPGVVIALYLLSWVVNGSSPAGFVWITAAAMTVSFAAFLVALGLRARRTGRLASVFVAERTFMIMQLIGATALAWLTYWGSLRP